VTLAAALGVEILGMTKRFGALTALDDVVVPEVVIRAGGGRRRSAIPDAGWDTPDPGRAVARPLAPFPGAALRPLPAAELRAGQRGRPDTFGTRLEVTVAAVADEIAAAADLVKAKTSGIPVAIVRGRADLVTDEDGPGGRALIRPPAEDMFTIAP